jgi:hypothetical protein
MQQAEIHHVLQCTYFISEKVNVKDSGMKVSMKDFKIITQFMGAKTDSSNFLRRSYGSSNEWLFVRHLLVLYEGCKRWSHH